MSTGDNRKTRDKGHIEIAIWKIFRITERHNSTGLGNLINPRRQKCMLLSKGLQTKNMTSHSQKWKPEDDWIISKVVKENHCQSRIYIYSQRNHLLIEIKTFSDTKNSIYYQETFIKYVLRKEKKVSLKKRRNGKGRK